MNPMIAGLAAASLLVGLVLIGDGLMARPRRSSTDRSTGLWTTVEKWWTSRSRSQRIQCVAGLVVGLLAFVATGWIVMLLAIPVIVVGLPALLGEPGNRDVEILEALDRWVRSLAASLPTGKSIIDAMRATAGQAPSLLQRPLRVMIARLDARWTTREALLALADDLDCPDADAVVAALVLAAERGGVGATATLEELADSVQTRLRALREIEAERAKPRVVVRQVTLISLVVLTLAVATEAGFFAPYRSPFGQVVLVGLVASYFLSLLVMRRMTIPRRRDRILGQRPTAQPSTGGGRRG